MIRKARDIPGEPTAASAGGERWTSQMIQPPLRTWRMARTAKNCGITCTRDWVSEYEILAALQNFLLGVTAEMKVKNAHSNLGVSPKHNLYPLRR